MIIMNPKRLVLIGLGPHARRIYYPLIEKHAKEQSIQLNLVVDVESQRESIERYLSGRVLQPEHLFFSTNTRFPSSNSAIRWSTTKQTGLLFPANNHPHSSHSTSPSSARNELSNKLYNILCR